MDSLYNWVVFVHIAGAFTFAVAHGASAAVALRLRQERELPRVQAFLDLSQIATGGMYLGLVVLLLGGVIAAFMAGLWGRGWIWTALFLLVLLIAYMYVRASSYYGDLRRAAGQPYFDMRARTGMPAGSPNTAELNTVLASSRPVEIAAVGGLGLLVIIWLMVLKPF